MNYKEACETTIKKLEGIIQALAMGRDNYTGAEKYFQGLIDAVSPIKNELAQNVMKAEYEELKNSNQ